MAEPDDRTSAANKPAPDELRARLARAYLSGNGAEVERVLGLIAGERYTLPPKSPAGAGR